MTFIPQKNEKYCFISCSEDKIKYTLDEELNKYYLIDKSSITNEENIVL